jgi:hypothetical protein
MMGESLRVLGTTNIEHCAIRQGAPPRVWI